MAKKVEAAQTEPQFLSLKDGAFQQAGAAHTLESFARFVLGQQSGFPKTIAPETRDELYSGYRMKFDSLRPSKMYAVVNDHIVLATEEHKAASNIEKIEIGVAYAYSYSQQEFGKLANTRPALHAIVKPIREACNTYCSNRLGDLKRAATKILNEGKERQRTANKDFAEFVDSWMKETAPERLKSAKARSDATANQEKFEAARLAFLVKWNS
jgi:hypothetical protein